MVFFLFQVRLNRSILCFIRIRFYGESKIKKLISDHQLIKTFAAMKNWKKCLKSRQTSLIATIEQQVRVARSSSNLITPFPRPNSLL